MKFFYLAFLLLIISLSNCFSQLTTTVNPSLTDLTNYFQGIGLTITNMSVTAAANSYGFYSGSSSMAFGSGIIMSTGVISNINDPASTFLSTDNMTPGSALGNSLSGGTTYDECRIEFDCVPSNSNLLFSFAFGSEEYNEFIGSNFNDVFGIMITGPNPSGGNYNNTNVALIPGTSTPMVSVNSINNGSSGTGPCINCAYFINNSGGTDVAFDGFTTGLQGVVPVMVGQTYHFTIIIDDVDDGIYDSCVMFLTNSFKSAPSSVAGISEIEEEKVAIYPNPTSGLGVKIDNKDNDVKSVELYSTQGKRIENIQFDGKTNRIELNGPAQGIYFLHLTTEKGKIVKKLVVN